MNSALTDGPLTPFIFLSFILHILVGSLLLVFTHFRGPTLTIPKRIYHVDLVSMKFPSKPKPTKELPQATLEQLQKPKPKKPPKPMIEPKKEIPKIKEELQKEIAKEPAFNEEIANIEEEMQVEEAIDQVSEELAQSLAPSENEAQDSEGENTASLGEAGEGSLVEGYEMLQYRQIVRNHVLSSWNLPEWTLKSLPENTMAILIVFIDAEGNVERTEFDKSSNVPFFDQSVVRAVKRSSPLPTPPEELVKDAQKSGIVMRFSPQKIQ